MGNLETFFQIIARHWAWTALIMLWAIAMAAVVSAGRFGSCTHDDRTEDRK